MKVIKLLCLVALLLPLTALIAIPARVYYQKCVLDSGEIPPVNNTGVTTSPDYIVRATILETGETLGTDLGHYPSIIRIYKTGNGTSVPYYVSTYVELSHFPTQWAVGQTLRMFVQHISTGQNTTWDLIIPSGSSAIFIQNPAQVIPPTTFGPATNPNPANGSIIEIASGSTLNLSWSTVSVADGYKLYWNGATDYIELSVPNWTTPVLSTGDYSWKVVPYKDNLDVPVCPTWHFSVSSIEINPASNPNPPTNSTFHWTEETTIILNWNPPSSGNIPTGYKLVFNNSVPIDLGLTYTWTTPYLGIGNHTWQVIPYFNSLEAQNCPVWNFNLAIPEVKINADGVFGDVWINHTVSKIITITHTRNSPLELHFTLPSGAFSLNPLPGSYIILPQDSLFLTVSFLPTDLTSYARNLYVETNDPDLPFVIISLTGHGYNLVSAFSAMPDSGLVPLTVNFEAQVQAAHAAWHWIFGDGSTGEGSSIEHTYNTIGEMEVTLVVEDNWGFSLSSTQTIQVINYANIQVSAEEILFPDTYLSDNTTLVCSITNLGPGNLDLQSVSLLGNNPAFSVELGSGLGILTPGSVSELEIGFAPLVDGVVSDSLIILSDALNSPRQAVLLQGRGRYVPPEAPTNVNVTIDNVDALITWDSVTQSIYGSPMTVPYYFIYGAKTPDAPSSEQFYLGYSTGTSFRHLGIGLPGSNIQPPGEYFYTVSAVIWYPPRGEVSMLDKYIGKATRKEMMDLLP